MYRAYPDLHVSLVRQKLQVVMYNINANYKVGLNFKSKKC